MYLGENLERKRERICREKCSKWPKSVFYFIFIFKRGSRGLYNENLTFWLGIAAL